MTETIPVIREAEAKDEAEAMGYRRFEGMEVDSYESFDIAPFRDSSTYCNHVLPRLRALAGFGDAGTGTYTIQQDIVVIPQGCEDDLPAEGERDTSEGMYEALVECWHNGAYRAVRDAAEGGD